MKRPEAERLRRVPYVDVYSAPPSETSHEEIDACLPSACLLFFRLPFESCSLKKKKKKSG